MTLFCHECGHAVDLPTKGKGSDPYAHPAVTDIKTYQCLHSDCQLSTMNRTTADRDRRDLFDAMRRATPVDAEQRRARLSAGPKPMPLTLEEHHDWIRLQHREIVDCLIDNPNRDPDPDLDAPPRRRRRQGRGSLFVDRIGLSYMSVPKWLLDVLSSRRHESESESDSGSELGSPATATAGGPSGTATRTSTSTRTEGVSGRDGKVPERSS